MDVLQQLALVYPEGKVVKLKNKDYQIKPFGIGQLPKLFKLLAPVMETLKTKSDNKDDKAKGLVDLLFNHSDVIISVFEIVIKEPTVFFDDLPADEGITLLATIVEVNEDIFTKKLLPLITSKVGQIENRATAGATV